LSTKVTVHQNDSNRFWVVIPKTLKTSLKMNIRAKVLS
jgi:hypothetical protein